MNQDQLLANWTLQKTSHNHYVLSTAHEVEFEFKGRYGHPSSYAFVKLRAEPAAELNFSVAVEWPEEFNAEYALRIQHTVAEAVVDGLIASPNTNPYRGCHVRLIGFRWDSIGGSEAAVARATSKAIELLREQAHWVFSDGHYRVYESSAD
ncbi:hypothetical protein [Hydrogenophaga sp. H7]|uniref:hypothetical protein n=1 Tax=Hydrogenophaga sp. H7 TaxID=1882399 RepID=UPI0009A2D327|nr:hypothetical protein [Hydrogenophaga sp. H7]OPF63630.1 hypothetical protein BC358_06800 [Hydrogenophaga sp. H7]